MSETNLQRLDWRTFMKAGEDTPADTIAALDDYFSHFAAIFADGQSQGYEMEATARPWKSSWREDDQHGSIYSMPHEGHAYAVAVKPRYVGREQWETDAALILHAVNNIDRITAERDAMRKALEWVTEQRWNEDADLDDICTRAEQALETTKAGI